MDLNFPKVVYPLPLSKYEPAYGDQCIDVWVNPLSGMAADISKSLRNDSGEEERKAGFVALAEIWSQGADESRHWTLESVEAFMMQAAEKDPMLFLWAVTETMQMLIDYRMSIKKNSLRA